MKRGLDQRPARPGTVLGISRSKIHVGLDDPPIDVKVYNHHIGRRLGERVGQGEDGIVRVDPLTGDMESVVTVEAGEIAHGPELLPGNDWLIFAIASSVSAWDESRIVAQSLTAGVTPFTAQRTRDGTVMVGFFVALVLVHCVRQVVRSRLKSACTAISVTINN